MKIKLALFVLIFLSSLFAQRQAPPIFYHTISFTGEADDRVFFLYKIPHNVLVFQRNGDNYKASYSFNIEIGDSQQNHVTRRLINKQVVVQDFEQTNNRELYSEGLFELNLPWVNLNLIPIFTDLNSKNEIKLPPLIVNERLSVDTKFKQPIVLSSQTISCGETDGKILPNFSGNIPFDDQEYDLIIPVYDEEMDEIYIKIVQKEKEIYSGVVNNFNKSNIILTECSERIALIESDNSFKTRNFILPRIVNKLSEGDVSIIIAADSFGTKKKSFSLQVRWFNKPLSLRNRETAIKTLRIIEDEDVVRQMLRSKTSDYDKVISEYWKKLDPTPDTEYNPLMNEFYTRVDYASTNFTPITDKSGIDTDRGKIYVQYGKPQKVERSSNEKGNVMEIWFYRNPDRVFIFVDKTGTGEFFLSSK
jgi:GWxTD domain-containing protein